MRITDELREFVDRNWPEILHETKTTKAYVLLAIADRIDEQFARVCEQQEAVLQKTIDGMVKEYEHDRESDQLRIEKLVKQRDAAYACADELSDELLRVRRERDELRARLDEYDSTHVELPRDKNDEVFHVDGGARVDDLVLTIRQMTLTKSGWKIRAYDEDYEVEREASFFDACAPKPDLIEETIEKLTLGVITQTEAVERIKSLGQE